MKSQFAERALEKVVDLLESRFNLDRGFARGFILMFGGYAITNVILFLANLIVARTFGPSRYGQLIVIQTISNILVIPMLFGQDVVMIRHAADSGKHTSVVLSSALLVAVTMCISVLTVILGLPSISKWANTSPFLVVLGLLWAVFLTMKYWGGAVYRALKQFGQLASIDIIAASVVLVGVIVLWLSNRLELSFYLGVIGLSCGLYLTGMRLLRKYQDTKKLWAEMCNWLRPLMVWGSIYMVTGVSGFFVNGADRIILNKYWGSEEVGLYGVYMSAASQLLLPFSLIFVNALFPHVAASRDKQSYLNMVNNFLKRFWWLIAGFNLLVTWIIVSLYGPGFQVRTLQMSVLSVAVCLNLWWQLRVPLMSSIDLYSFIYGTVSAVFISVASLYLSWQIIPILGIWGASGVIAVTALASFLAQEWYFRRFKYKLVGNR